MKVGEHDKQGLWKEKDNLLEEKHLRMGKKPTEGQQTNALVLSTYLIIIL